MSTTTRLPAASTGRLRRAMKNAEPLGWSSDAERDAWYAGYDARVEEEARIVRSSAQQACPECDGTGQGELGGRWFCAECDGTGTTPSPDASPDSGEGHMPVILAALRAYRSLPAGTVRDFPMLEARANDPNDSAHKVLTARLPGLREEYEEASAKVARIDAALAASPASLSGGADRAVLMTAVERNWNAGPDALVDAILACPSPSPAIVKEAGEVDALADLDRVPLSLLHELQHAEAPLAKPKLGGSIIRWAADEIAALRAALSASNAAQVSK